MQIVHAIFLSVVKLKSILMKTQIQTQQSEQSPLKILYQRHSRDEYQEQLKATFESLESVTPPFLKKKPDGKQLTLVLDLDETLGHFVIISFSHCMMKQEPAEKKFNLRPGINEFLDLVSVYYEIIVFTAGMQDVHLIIPKYFKYADQILNQIDKKNLISARLYRQHTTFFENAYVKDLSKLGRMLEKIIIVDNNHQNFALQPENGIIISSWFNNQQDKELLKMGTLLRSKEKQLSFQKKQQKVKLQTYVKLCKDTEITKQE